MRLAPDDLDYPVRLANLRDRPVLTTSGPLDHRGVSVAIVGSRHPTAEAVALTRTLAEALARANVCVISGGARGIDSAAHEAALAHGVTWCVAPCGRRHVYPPENRALFAQIAASERSRMIWPFADDQKKDGETPKQRNGVLVGLATAVVVVQAHFASGSRNAAAHARRMRKPLWVVPAAPWMPSFAGSLYEIAYGRARPLCHPSQLFRFLGLPWPHDEPRWPVPPLEQLSLLADDDSEDDRSAPDEATWTDDEKLVVSKLSKAPVHVDRVVEKTGMATSATITALLTLSLKDVVVEGPDGFFRRR